MIDNKFRKTFIFIGEILLKFKHFVHLKKRKTELRVKRFAEWTKISVIRYLFSFIFNG